MSRFIKLTNLIVNTNTISKIIVKPNKYYIMTKEIDGFEWKFAGSGFGNIYSRNTCEIEVCEREHPMDYKIVSDWISKI
jgi:hypothetical protein